VKGAATHRVKARFEFNEPAGREEDSLPAIDDVSSGRARCGSRVAGREDRVHGLVGDAARIGGAG
jgi:hypothetical protein